nr:putative capsid protein [Lasius neglectus picorna-like virus 8]
MTSLGESASNGVSGTVSEVRAVPDQLPDNPATITANTSIETLQQVLYDNWIWRNLFTIDSSMLPGHVFGVLKIHPKNCNDYITYISQMFKTWTGSFKIRTRFMATFQFGGSFRVGFLPPRFTEDEVQNMPLATLTAYPNSDLDPKNTDWAFFRASDERNILFHWMEELTDEKPESFGGWFVFYVAAPLVVSGTGSGETVSMLVEAAGDFQFSQLAPITAIAPSGNGWLDTANNENILADVGCDDLQKVDALVVLPVTTPMLLSGFTLSNPLGGNEANNSALHTPGSQFSSVDQGARHAFFTDPLMKPTVFGNGQTDILYEAPNKYYYVSTQGYFPGNLPKDFIAGAIDHSENFTGPTSDKHTPTIPNFQRVYIATVDAAEISHNTFFAPYSHTTLTLPDLSLYVDNNNPSFLQNRLPGESIIQFMNMRTRGLNLQTRSQAQSLAKHTYQNNMSQLYQLFTEDTPTPLLTLRLQPNGMWSTHATDVGAILSGTRLYLRYLQDLSMSAPLPPTRSEFKFIKAAEKFSQKPRSPSEYKNKLYRLF